jgi:hypothetical protein
VTVLPSEEAMLVVRGMCRFQLGDADGAAADCKRLKSLDYFNNQHTEAENVSDSIEKLKEYVEMICLEK